MNQIISYIRLIEGEMDVYHDQLSAKYKAVKLQTLAEKCLIPIYKLPKFAAELPDTLHDIYIHLSPSILSNV